MLKKGDIYKDFYVIDVTDVTDYKCQGIYLRHRTTGLEVFHLLNNDPENLFSFCFRTPVSDSKGAPHILEHSVLCGSEKYPLKEPFNTAAGKSVTTFLNAMTYPDKTCYPAASQIEKQYFYLMDCYADAVFFPNLSKNTFLQEAHRYELSEDGNLSIQGVVYNEMKGAFGNFYRSVYGSLIKAMFPGSTYEYESGGDPLEIPSFTYEEFLAFHKKYYSPKNCLFFMCGNISTEKQLDYFAENFIPRLEKKYNLTEECENFKAPLTSRYEEIEKLTTYKVDYKRNGDFHFIGPKSGPDENFSGICYYSGKPDMEKYFLLEVLCGSDSSPLAKALKESGLGADGYWGEITEGTQGFFTIGMIGVKKENEKKLQSFVQKTLKAIYKKGITQDEIDAAVMAIDFSLREERRSSGPKAIELMNKTMDGWNYGMHPTELLTPIQNFSEVKEKIKEDPDFFRHLMEKYFINDNGIISVTVEPSEKFLEERNAKEKALIEEAEKTINKENLKNELDALHQYQESEDSEEALACLKRLELSELPVDLPNLQPEIKTVNDITFLKAVQQTNGIVYFEVFFPFDILSGEEYLDLPLFSDSLLELGWQGKKWDKCILEANKIAGDISINGQIGTARKNNLAEAFKDEHKSKNFIGREWAYFTMKILDSRLDEGTELLSDIISGINFDDEKRMKTLIRECVSERKSALIPGGLDFCVKRAKLNQSRESAVQELIYGLTQVKHGMEYREKDAKALLKKFKTMYEKITNAGALIRIVADEDSMKHAESLLPDFIKKAGLKPLAEYTKTSGEELHKMIYKESLKDTDAIPVETQVGYAAQSLPNSPSITEGFAAETCLCEWLNTHSLWEKLRTVHGCYGASINCDAADETAVMTTYRDPNPVESFALLEESLKDASEHNFTRDEAECAVISMYSSFAMPRTPQNMGFTGCNRILYAQTQEQVDKALELVIKVREKDLKDAAERMYSNLKQQNEGSRAFLFDKKQISSGNILELPL